MMIYDVVHAGTFCPQLIFHPMIRTIFSTFSERYCAEVEPRVEMGYDLLGKKNV